MTVLRWGGAYPPHSSLQTFLRFSRQLLYPRRRQCRFCRLRRQLAARPHHVAQRHRAATRHRIPAVDDADPTTRSPLAVAGRTTRHGAAVRLPGLAGPQKIMNSETTGIWFTIA